MTYADIALWTRTTPGVVRAVAKKACTRRRAWPGPAADQGLNPPYYVARAIRAGASGFLSKGVAPEDLLATIRTIAAGDVLLSPQGDPGVDRAVPIPTLDECGHPRHS